MLPSLATTAISLALPNTGIPLLNQKVVLLFPAMDRLVELLCFTQTITQKRVLSCVLSNHVLHPLSDDTPSLPKEWSDNGRNDYIVGLVVRVEPLQHFHTTWHSVSVWVGLSRKAQSVLVDADYQVRQGHIYETTASLVVTLCIYRCRVDSRLTIIT